ncbi:MAG: GGDEF domain-containing protein [Rhodospirillales bacterium]|nr:GGDEF domain-containing protein [Rhodospirillales bacterium]
MGSDVTALGAQIEATVQERQTASTTAVQQTLAEQMRITSHEIEDRKRLLGISESDLKLLASCRRQVHEQVDEIVEEFYSIQTQTPEIALVIGDIETLSRLKMAMRSYILEMFEGQYDVTYVNKRLRIGKVHKRIGVSPKLYTTALRILHELLERDADRWCPSGEPTVAKLKQALQKIFMFDIQLVFDTYIASLVAEVQLAKDEVERYAASLEQQVIDRTMQLAEMSRQDMLTELQNQMAFYEHLRREYSAAERSGEPLCLIYIDLNDFKMVNDTKGHQVGDQLLATTARVIKKNTRTSDIPCPYGGDEFCVIVPRTGLDEAKKTCLRILKAFEKEDAQGTSLSIGVAQLDLSSGMTMDDLVRAADANMYKAKQQHKDACGNYMVA